VSGGGEGFINTDMLQMPPVTSAGDTLRRTCSKGRPREHPRL
jgi:hypothetical protein